MCTKQWSRPWPAISNSLRRHICKLYSFQQKTFVAAFPKSYNDKLCYSQVEKTQKVFAKIHRTISMHNLLCLKSVQGVRILTPWSVCGQRLERMSKSYRLTTKDIYSFLILWLQPSRTPWLNFNQLIFVLCIYSIYLIFLFCASFSPMQGCWLCVGLRHLAINTIITIEPLGLNLKFTNCMFKFPDTLVFSFHNISPFQLINKIILSNPAISKQ